MTILESDLSCFTCFSLWDFWSIRQNRFKDHSRRARHFPSAPGTYEPAFGENETISLMRRSFALFLSIFIQIFVGIQVFILFPALLEQQNIGVFSYFAGKSMVSSRFSLPTNFIRLRSDFCNTFQKARLYLSCYFHFSKCSFNFSARPGPASTSSCLWSLTEATPREGDESAPHLLARN